MVPFLDLKRAYASLKKEIDHAVAEVVASGRYILGPNVAAFEVEFARYIGTRHAIGVASGTDAIHLALQAVGVSAGDEVITTPFTFVATAEAIEYLGAKPVFVDIDRRTFNLDVTRVEAKITPRTKAILPVYLYGQVAEMEPLADLARKYNLKIIEDCAQATGANYNGKKAGNLGEAGCFSFFPTKNLGGFGDGGMITSSSDELAEKIRMLHLHGGKITYHYDLLGRNSRLDEIQAALLLIKLKYLDRGNKMRQEIALHYGKLLRGLPLEIPAAASGGGHVFNQYTLRVKSRDALRTHLAERGISTMVYYPLSLHLQKVFQPLGYRKGEFPETERAQAEVLSLPIFPELTQAEVKEVAEGIKSFF